MERIKLELSDWLYNAGIVGMANILNRHSQNSCLVKDNYIEFDIKKLDEFEEKYFKYFIEKYEKYTSCYKILNTNFELKNITKPEQLEALNKQIEYIKTKLKSASYQSVYKFLENETLLEYEKQLKKITKKKNENIEVLKDKIEEQINLIEKIKIFINETKDMKKYIYSKNIIYDVISNFWNNVSFLFPQTKEKDVYKDYKEHFIVSVKNFKEEEKSKNNCFVCNRKIKNQKESFGITWLNNIGVDTTRKTSHFWNFNNDIQICPICNLVYSCIPAGFTFLNRKGIFINDNSNAENLIKINSIALSEKGGAQLTIEDLENQSYFKIVDTMEQAKINKTGRELENIQVVKLDSNNIQRPYTFNVLDKNLLEIIKTHEKDLKFLLNSKIKITDKDWLNLYPEVLKRLYNNKNQFDLVYQMFSLLFQKKNRNFSAIETILKINNNFLNGNKKEEVFMSDEKKEIEVEKIRNYGYWVRKDFEQKNEDKKLEGISYRLLNTLRTKNQMGFMDNLIQVYWGKEIPSIFTKALADVNDFQTIGYAFLLGLQGKKENKERNDNENSNITEEKTNE